MLESIVPVRPCDWLLCLFDPGFSRSTIKPTTANAPRPRYKPPIIYKAVVNVLERWKLQSNLNLSSTDREKTEPSVRISNVCKISQQHVCYLEGHGNDSCWEVLKCFLGNSIREHFIIYSLCSACKSPFQFMYT